MPSDAEAAAGEGGDEAADEGGVPFRTGEIREGRCAGEMKVAVFSFSYKRGLPEDRTGNGGGFVFDCRAMPNPYWEAALRGCTGRDNPVVYFAERMSERLRGIDGVDVEVAHAAMPFWKPSTTPAANPQAD